MALFVRQDQERSELQQRLAAELRERAKKRAENDSPLPDGVDDSNYLKDTKKTSSLAGVWIGIIAVALILMVMFIIKQSS
ncbi:MAG TPA: hypothetical protein VL481_00435 [Verrucomicrobiae bacterium]|jgi:hypothetical protein|nr:hypothetical protein [Verrucomicrobiae bacterium]